MRFYTEIEARALMNKWGAEQQNFLFIVDYKKCRVFLELLCNVDSEEVLFAFPSASNDGRIDIPHISNVVWNVHPESFEVYSKKIGVVKRHLHQGNSFLTNLTCRIPVETNLSLLDIYLHSSALYKLWMKDRFVCFSPEIFIRIENGYIHSYPMKGTLSAEIPNAGKMLMDDEKEAAEHATIVDLIRNDLSIVAKDVHVSRYRYMDLLQTNKGGILQTSSDIEGKMPTDYLSRIGDILFDQLPAGSITGAPKKKTLEIIDEAEDYDRGFYTGVMGVCKDGVVDSAVMIRFVENDKGNLYFKAGGGITAQSRDEDEYNEVIQKAYVPIY